MIDLTKYTEIYIWGASFPQGMVEGDATSHGRAIENLRDLLKSNGYWDKVVGIVDSRKDVQGKERLGIPVSDPTALIEHKDALVIINTISIIAIQKAMKNLGIHNDYVVIPYYFYHGTLEHIYDKEAAFADNSEHEDEIKELYYMPDAVTNRYIDIICATRNRNEDDLYLPDYYEGTGENLNYFCDSELAPKGDVTYIDVGAYDGNSIEPIIKFYGENVKKILAFEPDEKSRIKLKEYVRARGIENKTKIFQYALGSENKEIHLSSSGLFSIVSDDGETVLDLKVFDQLPAVDIIGDAMVKMDIEGSELDALKGMKELLSVKQPYLAICLYHKVEDLYEIAKFIKTINSSYRLYLRGGWHLECWAVPERHFI